jgi:branched-chain amino acid aminotransferase
MIGHAFIGNSFCELADAKISIFDPGFYHSDVVYDVISTWRGQFFRLDDHIQRFLASCSGFRLSCPCSAQELKRILATCVDRGRIAEGSYVSIALTRGQFMDCEARGAKDIFRTIPTLIAFAVPYISIADEMLLRRGMRTIIARTRRIPDACVDSRHKSYHWGDLTAAKFEAKDAGADTAVLLSVDGFLTEGPGFNLFFARKVNFSLPGGIS